MFEEDDEDWVGIREWSVLAVWHTAKLENKELSKFSDSDSWSDNSTLQWLMFKFIVFENRCVFLFLIN